MKEILDGDIVDGDIYSGESKKELEVQVYYLRRFKSLIMDVQGVLNKVYLWIRWDSNLLVEPI